MCFVFFFFKQKTAYEMCGRDWSSDVCSSDLNERVINGVRFVDYVNYKPKDIQDLEVLDQEFEKGDRKSVV